VKQILDYNAPSRHKAARRSPPFWLLFFASALAGCVLMDLAVRVLTGRWSRDGGLWFLELLGVASVSFVLSLAPREPVYRSPRTALVAGVLAPPCGLVIYLLVPWR
jgi:hypothetical protein